MAVYTLLVWTNTPNWSQESSMTATADHDDLLLLPEVAELTRQSIDTLRGLRHRGEGPQGFRMGRRVVYRRSEVLDWIAAHEQAEHASRAAG